MNRDDLVRVRDWAKEQVEARERARERRKMFTELPLPSIGHFDFMIDVEVKARASTIRAMRSSQNFGEALIRTRSEFDALLDESRRRTALLQQLLRRIQGGQ